MNIDANFGTLLLQANPMKFSTVRKQREHQQGSEV